MTCYLRMHEVVVAVHSDSTSTDWDEVARLWRAADGVDGRDDALDAMPVTLVEMDDLPMSDLDDAAGLVFSGRSDQRLLSGMADRIARLLDRGAAVVFSGRLNEPWLRGTSVFEREACAVSGAPVLADHPVLRGVDPDDLGPSFLYDGGWHRPPDGAEVIAWRADATPGAYVARSGSGTVLVHGGANLLANATTDSSAARIVPQLIEWVAAGGGR